VSLLDEERARAGVQLLLDELEFALAQPEAMRVLLRARFGLGKNTLVGVCSMIVRLMELSSTSLALCVARHMTPFSLRQVFGPPWQSSRTRDPPAVARIHPSSTPGDARRVADARGEMHRA